MHYATLHFCTKQRSLFGHLNLALCAKRLIVNIEISKEDQSKLQKLEEELWIEETRFDRPYMKEIMASDFFEIGRSGRVHSRESCLSHERVPINAIIPLQNLQIRLLTHDVAQVTYDSEVTYDRVVEKGRRSSIWTRFGESWKLRFHQGTAVYN